MLQTFNREKYYDYYIHCRSNRCSWSDYRRLTVYGRVAQLAQHFACTEVFAGSTPVTSTILLTTDKAKAREPVCKQIYIQRVEVGSEWLTRAKNYNTRWREAESGQRR